MPSRYSEHRRLEPRQDLLPRARADEGRPRRVLRLGRRLRAAAPAAPAVSHEAVPERRRRRVLPPEARAGKAPGVRRRGLRAVPVRALDGLRDRRQRRRARVGREPRLHRAAHVVVARAGDRAARLPADRPRSHDRRAVAVRARDRARRARGHGRARAALVSEDVRRHRAAHSRADQAGARVPARAPVRDGAFVDFGQNARDRTIASAYSVRPTPDARVSAPLLWDEVANVEPEAFTLETMAARIAAVGDPMRGMWRNPPSLRTRFARLELEPPDS